MKTTLLTIGSASLLCFLLLGCGEEGSSTKIPEEGPVDQETFENLLPEVVCDKVAECECRGDNNKRSYCENSVELFLDGLLHPDLDGIGFDGQAAWECLNAAQNADCSHADWLEFCASVPIPELEPGATCTIDPQCAGAEEDEAHCARDGETGICVAAPRRVEVGLGEPCWATRNPEGFMNGTDNPQGDDVCALEDDLYCDASGVCAPVGQVGDSCGNEFHCALGNHCSAESVCIPSLALGDACDADIPYTTACGFENNCSEEGTCAEKEPLGAACTNGLDCASYNCSAEGTCVDMYQETVCEHFAYIELGD